MFKKTGYINLTTLSLVATVCFVLSGYYCAEMPLTVKSEFPSETCGNGMVENCCHNENKYVVLTVDFIQSKTVKDPAVAVADVLFHKINSLFNGNITGNVISNSLSVFISFQGNNRRLALNQSFLL